MKMIESRIQVDIKISIFYIYIKGYIKKYRYI